MPWKVTTTMEQKIEFICEWRTGKYTITELCKNFEISRPTAYKLIDRFKIYGYEGLREHSRTPRNHPNKTNGAIRWKSYYWVYLTAALKGKYVGIEELGNGIWKVFYRNVFLGYFNEKELRNKESSTRLETNLV